MNHHVVIEKLCLCALKYKTQQIRSFDTKDEAFDEANEWAESLSNSFCGKHGFEVIEVGESFVIALKHGGYNEPCEI